MNDNDEILDNLRLILQEDATEVCLSGGATGADSLWSRIAAKHDIGTIHFSFSGHKKYCPSAEGVRLEISQPNLNVADRFLMKAKKRNHRSYPCRSLDVSNLLRRNYYQIVDSNACYAVSRIEHNVVDGGTSWAVAMFIDKWMLERQFDECPCYVYDMLTSQWFQWQYDEFVIVTNVPTPKGIWTGIGSRELTLDAITAMENLWQLHKIH